MEDRFYLADQVNRKSFPVMVGDDSFERVCRIVRNIIDASWNEDYLDTDAALRIQKNAITGHENEVSYFIEKIAQILEETGNRNVMYPDWYDSLESAVYHENWGLSGLAEWFSPRYRESSSAKIIGERVYFMDKGQMVLKPQRISRERRQQMIRAFLLLSPEERLDKDIHELYMLDGTRVTVFNGALTKYDQDVMIFRRYTVPVYRFEEQAARGSIPYEGIGVFKEMVNLGYNVVICGAVRTSKTSFLTTWQSYENTSLEGVMIETDPEIRMHEIMPDAPVVQLIADDEKLEGIVKNLLRSDADYFIIAEARNGIAVDTAVKIASKGNRRMKMTYHEREPCDFCIDAAAEIVKTYGGNLNMTTRSVAKSFDYIFHFVQLRDKSQKRLKSVHEIVYDDSRSEIRYYPICVYDMHNDCWEWNYHISEQKMKDGLDEDESSFLKFKSMLNELGGGRNAQPVVRMC